MTFINGKLTHKDIQSLTKKNIIRIGSSTTTTFPSSSNNHNLEILTTVLQTTTTLRTLQLDDSATAFQNVKFVTALTQNTTIRFLNLRQSQCDDKGAIALASILKENSTIQTISLNDNHIGNVGAIALAEGLKVNRAVRKLYLNDNCIGEEGARALMDVKSGADNGGTSLLQIISLRRNNLSAEEEEGREFQNVFNGRVVEKDLCQEKEKELTEKSLKRRNSPTAFLIESSSSVTCNKTCNKINHDGPSRTTTENTNNTSDQQQQIEIDALLAERKLMMQQLDNLSTAQHEARDELAAKDAVIRMKEDQILVQRKQLAHCESEVNEIRVEHQRTIQKLQDKLSCETALAAARVAAKDAELKRKDDEIVNLRKHLDQMEKAKVVAAAQAAAKDAELKIEYEEILNLHQKELDQIEAARDAAERKAVAKEAELSFKNHVVVMKDAELSQLKDQLTIQRNELVAKMVMGQNQSKQLVDKFTVDIARMKSLEVLRDDLLKTKDEEILNQGKQLEVYAAEMNTKDTELKKKHDELLDQISSNEKLRVSLDEMKCRVEQLSAQNAEMAAAESKLKKMNEDLSAKNSKLTTRVGSLKERLKYSKAAVDLVDLTTTETTEEKRSGEKGLQREEMPSKIKKRRRITSGVAVASNDTTDDEGSQNVANIAEATQRSKEFKEALEKYKADIVELLRRAASKGEKDVSADAVIQTRMKHIVGLKRACPLISDQEMITAFSKAESDASGAFVQSLRQNRAAPVVHRPNRIINLE
mmetsp:Transcript_27897/g.43857  ORF Transcript_27897/g.43857 Transcript_27897/m.43857 type:complete len:761 (+) Transcript_27897:100-2382(+)|eukprot:CAMPEP_0201738286 /NCGR_PEP_ID=MMETSP0593-20130828/44627_1 /ASSEMBLY_ACC=CAM_ASM_000672 /TAXON_ID=267983 /ORGANISM="Skeletonema japonicum, Strain CCMP2506" /LENGTH=760 /DNA_ID=CAMNT_0048232459 /DNA_START=22 /DNA_END=2304 /DNA_ORIENTATION=-